VGRLREQSSILAVICARGGEDLCGWYRWEDEVARRVAASRILTWRSRFDFAVDVIDLVGPCLERGPGLAHLQCCYCYCYLGDSR
jgi:hypothetical protein